MILQDKFFIALGVTSLVEVPLAFLIVRYLLREKRLAWHRILIIAFFASFSSLPYLWFIMPPYLDAHYYLIYGESLVVAYEFLFYWYFLGIKWHKALVLSVLCNVISYYLGVWLL